MIAVCLLPVLALEGPELATLLAVELVGASAVAFVLVWGTWALFPNPQAPAKAADMSARFAAAVSSAMPGVRD
jgi:hypothetical protein